MSILLLIKNEVDVLKDNWYSRTKMLNPFGFAVNKQTKPKNKKGIKKKSAVL
jgi:hypothetical protein